MPNETAADAFARRALTNPAVPLERVADDVTRPPLLRARTQVDLLIAADGEASAAAERLDELIEAMAGEAAVRPDAQGDLTVIAESMANAVIPLARAVLVRDLAPGHRDIQPLLELADRVAPI